MKYENHNQIQEGKKPLPLEKMSLKAFDKDQKAQSERGCEKRGGCDKRDKLENQARMIRMAMQEHRNKSTTDLTKTNLSALVSEAKRECDDCDECSKCSKSVCPVCEKNPCICSDELKEAVRRINAVTGNLISVEVYWRGRNFLHKMFFAQAKFPTRQQVIDQINKVYPGARLIRYKVATDFEPGMLLQVREGIDKDSMPCNKPKAQAVGDSKTGKSHVVKACEGGKEKIIRFGQRGVKGSPKKEGESEAYAKRRQSFKARHAKNIAKGKMSAAYWADKTKW
jgi:hypothetical protein